MKVCFLLLRNENNGIKKSLAKQVESIIESKFDVSNSCFSIELEGGSVDISYSIRSIFERTVDLTLASNASPTVFNARAFDEAIQNIIKGLHRKDLNIILAYDEASEVFCKSLTPYFSKYERKLRRLIYITITKTLGNDWFDLSFTDEQKKHLRKRKPVNKLLTDNLIDELDYGSINKYLFQPLSFVSIDDVLDGQLNESAINDMEKEEIIELINTSRKKSIWERFFGEYEDIRDLPRLIENLNYPRNVVMHNKTMQANLFDETKQTLKVLNKMLDKAILYAESKMYTELEIVEVSYSLHNTFGALSLLSDKIAEIYEPLKSSLDKIVVEYSRLLPKITIDPTVYKLDTSGIANSLKLFAVHSAEYDEAVSKLRSALKKSFAYNLNSSLNDGTAKKDMDK